MDGIYYAAFQIILPLFLLLSIDICDKMTILIFTIKASLLVGNFGFTEYFVIYMDTSFIQYANILICHHHKRRICKLFQACYNRCWQLLVHLDNNLLESNKLNSNPLNNNLLNSRQAGQAGFVPLPATASAGKSPSMSQFAS